MTRTRLFALAFAAPGALGLAACSDSDEINAASGALVGAAIGSQVGEGRGTTAATLTGAAVGAQVGATANDRRQ